MQGGISEDDANEFAAMVNFMQQVYSNPDGVPDMLLHEDDSEYSDDNRGGNR